MVGLSKAQRKLGMKIVNGNLYSKLERHDSTTFRVIRNCDNKKPTLYGSEMECPVYIDYRELPHMEGHHGDGRFVYEYKTRPTDLKSIAEFTLECDKRVLDTGGELHSFYERGEDNNHCDRCNFDRCDYCTDAWEAHRPSNISDVKYEAWQNGELDDMCDYCPYDDTISTCDMCEEIDYLSSFDNFTSMGDSCSNHIHASPRHYNIYDNLYWLTRLFAPLFSSSPSIRNADTYLSERRRTTSWARASYIDEIHYYEGINSRDYNALTPNSKGTLEFRYNDFSKTPATPLLFGALFEISRILPRKSSMISRTIGSTPTVRRFESRVPTIKAFANKITSKVLKDQQFYSWYSGNMVHFNELVDDMIDIELSAYKGFNGDISDWTAEFTEFVRGRTVPNVLSTIKDGQFVES